MKILLSKDELFEFKFPEVVSFIEFRGIVAKFNFLEKNFLKFNPESEGEEVMNITEQKEHVKQDKNKWIMLRDNRNVFIEILKTYYTKSFKEFEDVLKKYNININREEISTNKVKALREMHKIKPQEVGLTAFPSRGIFANKLLIK